MPASPTYHNEERIEISLVQLLMAGIIVMVCLVLPAQYILTQQQPSTAPIVAVSSSSVTNTAQIIRQTATTSTPPTQLTNGRVAGASTANQKIVLPFINMTLDFSQESTWLGVMGGGLVGFSILAFLYLSFSSSKPQKLPAHWG